MPVSSKKNSKSKNTKTSKKEVVAPVQKKKVQKAGGKAIKSIIGDLSDNGGIVESANKVKGDLGNIKTKVDELEQSLQRSKNKIEELKITSASSIANPFTIEVSPVSAISATVSSCPTWYSATSSRRSSTRRPPGATPELAK